MASSGPRPAPAPSSSRGNAVWCPTASSVPGRARLSGCPRRYRSRRQLRGSAAARRPSALWCRPSRRRSIHGKGRPCSPASLSMPSRPRGRRAVWWVRRLVPLMTTRFGSLSGDDRAIATAAAQGISTNFAAWQNGVTVPGLPWYPTFAAVPGPVAPPTPNVPVPLVALASFALGGMTDPNTLQAAMAAAAGVSLRERAEAGVRLDRPAGERPVSDQDRDDDGDGSARHWSRAHLRATLCAGRPGRGWDCILDAGIAAVRVTSPLGWGCFRVLSAYSFRRSVRTKGRCHEQHCAGAYRHALDEISRLDRPRPQSDGERR